MSNYGWTNEEGEPIMDGAAYRFEQALDEDARADYYADHFYDNDGEEECEPGHDCTDCYRQADGVWKCEYCDEPCADHDEDGAPVNQWEVTDPGEWVPDTRGEHDPTL